jgi:predicted dinucleotide-utilizing enzyme
MHLEGKMSDNINVALVGLGRIGQQFAMSLANHIKEGDKPISIIAVAEQDPNSEAAKRFADEGAAVFTDATEIASLGDRLDIIFDLTGVPAVRQALREKLQELGNRNTVIVPEVFARLLWSFLEDDAELTAPVRNGY